MDKKYDVTALGELLVDFTQNGTSAQGNYMFEANPGGAPCNVLAMLARLGKKTAFIGKVGDDFLGRHLKEEVGKIGIATENLFLDRDVHTTLAFVHTYEDGERDFSFYRDPGADMNLREEEIDADTIRHSKVFHFGSLSMTHETCRKATQKAIRIAKESGCILSFDPNLREPLWRTLEEAHERIAFGLSQCDILKISDNELQWFTGELDFDKGIQKLQETYRIPLILLSMGKDGSRAYYQGLRVEEGPFLNEHTIETTGAGDTFCACVLNGILERGLSGLTEENLSEMLRFANAAASLVTTRKGALKVMPGREEVEDMLRQGGRGPSF